MKNLTILITLLLMATAGNVTAQPIPFPEVTTVMQVSKVTANLPINIEAPGATRGAAFNGQYVFVASRQGGNHIYYWNVFDPTAGEMELDMTGIEGGTFAVNDITAAGEHIFASNMDFAGGNFKLYHWSNLNSPPQVLISMTEIPYRLGDAVSVTGDPATEAKIFVSGLDSPNMYIWTMQNGALVAAEPQVITFTAHENINLSRITQYKENYVLSGPFGIDILDANYNIMLSVPDTFFPGKPMHAHVFDYGGERYLALLHTKLEPTPAENTLYVATITEGDDLLMGMQNLTRGMFGEMAVHSADLGDVPNGNFSVSLDVVTDATGYVWIMAFAAGNGFVVQRIGEAQAQGLPFSETFDGAGETTPGTWLPQGWTSLDSDDDGNNWFWTAGPMAAPNGHMASQSAYVDDENVYQALTPDNWLMSPLITLSEITADDKIELSFGVGPGAASGVFKPENYSVLVSTTDRVPGSFTSVWTETFTQDMPTNTFTPRKVDLSAYAGQSVYIAFRHHNVTNMDMLLLDNIDVQVVTDDPGDDVIYALTLQLPAGTYSYKYFVVADQPTWDFAEWAGEPNRTIVVAGAMTVEDVWGEKPIMVKTLSQEEPHAVTFKVDMAGVIAGEGANAIPFNPDSHSVYLSGNFPGADWSMPGSDEGFKMVAEGTVDVPLADAQVMQLFPNPASLFVMIKSDVNIDNLSVSDLSGRVVLSLSPHSNEVQLDTSTLRNGLYLITISSGSNRVVNKLQVQR